MASSRKTHVYRLYQIDPTTGLVEDPNVWVDLLRIDLTVFNEERQGPEGLTHLDRYYGFRWGDNTQPMTDGGEKASQSRIYETLLIQQPGTAADGSATGGGWSGAPEGSDSGGPGVDASDPSLVILAIPVIWKTRINMRGSPQGFAEQSGWWAFQNFSEPTGRRFTALRITNNDLNNEITYPVPNAGDPPPPLEVHKCPSWETYLKALQDGTIDDSQYVDIAVTDRFKVRFPPSPPDSAGKVRLGQVVTYCLANRQVAIGDPMGVEDWFASPPAGGEPDSLPRTDPLQIIVNISWGGLAVEFKDGWG